MLNSIPYFHQTTIKFKTVLLRSFLKKNITNELSLGLIIPKKKIALASNRNFVKRRAREIIRNKKFLGHDIIFLVKQKIKDFDKTKVKNHINNLKRKLESISNATQSNQ